jgi:phospholipid-translocating ATPase
MQYRMLYQEGPQNLLFRWSRILGWMLYGVASAVVTFFLSISALQHQAFRRGDGHRNPWCDHLYVCGLGRERSDGDHSELLHLDTAHVHLGCHRAMVSSYLLVLLFCFRVAHIVVVHAMIRYVFLVAYGAITPTLSTSYFTVLVEAQHPTGWPPCWCPPPRSSPSSPKAWFFPDYHNKIQWRLRRCNRGQPDSSNADTDELPVLSKVHRSRCVGRPASPQQ